MKTVATGLALVLAMAGCQTTNPEPVVDVNTPTKIEKPIYTPVAGLSPNKRFIEAVNLLNMGRAEEARIELETVLTERPRHPRANRLLSDIDMPIGNMFGTESFDYTVKAGESLSNVSNRFLGDPFRFYALARYNDISDPTRIAAGQTLRIPGTRPPAPAVIPAAGSVGSEDAPEQQLADASPSISPEAPDLMPDVPGEQALNDGVGNDEMQMASAAAEEAAADALEAANDVGPDMDSFPPLPDSVADAGTPDEPMPAQPEMDVAPQQAQPLSLAQVLERADTLMSDGEFVAASDILSTAAELYPNDPVIRRSLISAIEGQANQAAVAGDNAAAAESYVRLAQMANRDGDDISAFQFYRDAVEYDESVGRADGSFQTLQENLSEEVYREGLTELRKHRLDEAIELFERTLEFDPDHSNAQMRLSDARDMKDRLEELEREQ
ncbi:MAG: LysM peptidoglycan-binding domain-containing protein [Pseudomonadota bacterium]